MNVNKIEYQIFVTKKPFSIYELARKNPKPIYIVDISDCEFSSKGIECLVCFSGKQKSEKTFTVIVKDKKRLAKKIENVVKSYCNNFGFAYAKTSSIRSARNKLAKEPVKSVPTDKKELWHKIEKMEREIRELKKQLSK